MTIKFVIFAGKELGYESLNFLIRTKNYPKFVIINDDDNGKDTALHKSCKKIAKKYKLNVHMLSELKKQKYKDFENLDYIFCLGSTKIIPQLVLDKVKIGAINIHPSLLPKYRGRYSTVKAILNNDGYSGLTIHWINKKIDYGNIILRKKIPIKKTDTAKDLYENFTYFALNEFKILFRKIIKGEKIKSQKIKKTTTKYYDKKLPNDGLINWKWSGEKILNFIRCMTYEPLEPPKFYLGNKTFYVVEKKLLKKKFFQKSPK